MLAANKPRHRLGLDRHLFAHLTMTELEKLTSITNRLQAARENQNP